MTVSPPKSLNLSCLAISSAASRLVFKAVLSILRCNVFFPELTSIAMSASVVLITMDPPERRFTFKLYKSFI